MFLLYVAARILHADGFVSESLYVLLVLVRKVLSAFGCSGVCTETSSILDKGPFSSLGQQGPSTANLKLFTGHCSYRIFG